MSTPPPRLPRSDFIVIPLLAVLTVLGLCVLGEALARTTFVESGSESCTSTAASGVSVMRPNCTSHRKAAEGPDTVNSYNDCGYRAPQPCGERPAGTLRIALMGASTAQGLKVRYADSFAARLAESLSRDCHRPVEVQNMGVAGAGLLDIYRRLDEALALHPDLILLVFTPYEMKAMIPPAALEARNALPETAAPAAPAARPGPLSLVSRLSDLAFNSRLLVVAQHFLFEDPGTFIRLFMLHGEDADYLRLPYRAGWEHRLHDVDTLLGDIATRARAAGVPVAMALGPQRIQAALLDPATRPAQVDPFEIGRRLAAIAASHGIVFQDTLDGFAQVNRPDAMFYAVDGHMDAAGHAVFATSVRQRLLREEPALRGCADSTAGGAGPTAGGAGPSARGAGAERRS